MTLIFDIGRTHKKTIIFDESYHVVYEDVHLIPDIKDEDGDPCEDLSALKGWMVESVEKLLNDERFDIKGINFSAHGAAMVHLNANGIPVTPLYDYMKKIPQSVSDDFYGMFGGREEFSPETGSPVLNMLNSGIQLFWLRKQKPELFERIRQSLHLPQYGNFLFTRLYHADITSIGCHTGLWDFSKNKYHRWLRDENFQELIPVAEGAGVYDEVELYGKGLLLGIGLHDSSSALLPFVYTAKEPFLLLSTGTWNITMNPYFNGMLSKEDYEKDCLYYLLDLNRKVASSRIFLGNEYQYQVELLAAFFHKPEDYHKTIKINSSLLENVIHNQSPETTFFPLTMNGTGPFPDMEGREVDLSLFASFEEAYHKLMLDLVALQVISIRLVCGDLKRLYISGGFIHNQLFLELLQAFLPGWDIFLAENKRASALGAAVVLHKAVYGKALPQNVAPIIKFVSTVHLEISDYKNYFTEES